MKPEKRPVSKIPRVRKKKAVPVMFGAARKVEPPLMALEDTQRILNGDVYVRDGATLELRAKEMNYLQWLKNKYLLIGILIGMGFGYGLHSVVTWL